MSRTTLGPQLEEIVEDIAEIVDKTTFMSRATLRLKLKKILLRIKDNDRGEDRFCGQIRQQKGRCHVPP